MIERGDLIIQYYRGDEMWYVQEVHLLDCGRFKDEEAAIEHKKFLEEKFSGSY